MTVGAPARGVLDGFSFEAEHTVELVEGDEVEITVRAGTSDAFFTFLGPDEERDPFAMPLGDDGAGGLYDLDPRETFTVEKSGTHRVLVSTYDGVVGGYELTVERAAGE